LHHEKLHGQGYWGFNSSDLPLHVNIVAVSDVFCALLSKRVYKEPWPVNKALDYIADRAGTDYCPRLADRFVSVVINCNSILSVLDGLGTITT
jgi:putative two-component system response regulator